MVINIPTQIQGFNFVIIDNAKNPKKPLERGWQKRIHRIDDTTLLNSIKAGNNYGVQSNGSAVIINDKSHFLVAIDFDTKEFQEKVMGRFPETFTTTSGSSKNCVHLWFASDDNKAYKIKDKALNTLADFIGAGNQIIAPGSKHSSGSIYSVVKDVPIAFMSYAEISAILKPYDEKPKRVKKPMKQFVPKGVTKDIGEKIINAVSMENVLSSLNVDTDKNPTGCPLHSSAGGKCLSWNNELIHCFHCEGSWNKFSFVREIRNLTDKQTFDWFAKESGMEKELEEERETFSKKQKYAIEGGDYTIMSRRGQIEQFWEKQPFYYDSSRIFWLWDKENYRWAKSDEVDFCNQIYDTLNVDTIDSKARSEVVEGFKQIGRKHKPLKADQSWVQFKDDIYDGRTGKFLFKATPDYFITNPLPHKMGESEETPIVDKLFSDWVGEENKIKLYELFAYSMTPDRFMQRLFALCGGGSNGKGTTMKLLQMFLGLENITSSELKQLSENQFETAVLYRKLVCIMGEISHSDLRDTNQLKRIAGEDLLRYCFKGKIPFSDINTALCIALTNSLPSTPDKSIGFYRKWNIIDFPNQFLDIKGNVLLEVSQEELENLSLKCFKILKNLYKVSSFTNEGSFDDRVQRYEERSNPVMHFLEEYYEEIVGENIPLRDFSDHCNKVMKEKHLRILSAKQIGKIIRDEGYANGNRTIGGTSMNVILNLKIKENYHNYHNYPNPESKSHGKSTENNDSLDSLDSFSHKKEDFITPEVQKI